MVADLGRPEYQGYLSDNVVTIAEALKSAGYRTLMSGKWHVGGDYNNTDREDWDPGGPGYPIPTQRGFDRYFGIFSGGGSYFFPKALAEQDTLLQPDLEGFYLTDAISDNAGDMIEEATAGEDPFFMYVAYTAPHWPLHALEEDIARYEGKYRTGWDALRTGRHEELKEMGILDEKWEISPRDPDSPPWDEAADHDWEDIRMAVYSAQIDRARPRGRQDRVCATPRRSRQEHHHHVPVRQRGLRRVPGRGEQSASTLQVQGTQPGWHSSSPRQHP